MKASNTTTTTTKQVSRISEVSKNAKTLQRSLGATRSFLLIDTTVETVLRNENTQHTEAYKSGLITKIELIENSQLKDLAKHF